MEKLFENEDFILSSTGRDYDFVGTIEVKGDKPLTFFFSEELIPTDEEDEDCEWVVNENETEFKGAYCDVEPYDEESGDGYDHAEEVAQDCDATSWFTSSKKDEWSGFLSDPKQRGWFLALIKAYCPEKLNSLPWVEDGKSFM